MDDLCYGVVKEELEQAKKRILAKLRGFSKVGNQNSARRNMKLQFKNGVSEVILTGEEIRGQCKNPLEVVLVDESTGNRVDIEPESSATVEILLLKGESIASEGDDRTVEQFNENIVRETEKQKPLLAGNQCIRLQNGIGSLVNIKFRHHATKMRPSVFKLGARVIDTFDGVHIKEAKTESFVVKDFRKKYYIKHEIPSLSDEVSRLVNIRKGGKIEKRLQDHKICTVEDFLVRHLIDPEGLNSIVNLAAKKWKLTVENALACPSDKRMYFYMNDQKMIGVVFSLRGKILGLYMERQYTSTNMLSEKHKANAEELLDSAYEHWEKVEPFDGEDSLQQYFSSLDCPVGGREDALTSEMVGESSSRSNVSFSAMNLISETGIEDFRSFGTDDVEIIHDDFLQLSPYCNLDFENPFPDFDEFLNQNDNQARQFDGHINELNDDESVESKNVGIHSKPSKRWRQLFCVSKWFSIRKMVSVEGIHNRKKQRVD